MFQDCNLARASSCAELNAQPAHAPRPRRRGSRRYPGAGAEPLLVGGSPSLEGEARRARLANPVHSPVRNAASSVAISRSRWAILAIVARLTSAVWQRPGINTTDGEPWSQKQSDLAVLLTPLARTLVAGPGLSGRAFSGSSSGGHGPGPSPLLGCDRAVTSPEHGALASLEVARALRLECVDGGWGRVGRPAATADGAGPRCSGQAVFFRAGGRLDARRLDLLQLRQLRPDLREHVVLGLRSGRPPRSVTRRRPAPSERPRSATPGGGSAPAVRPESGRSRPPGRRRRTLPEAQVQAQANAGIPPPGSVQTVLPTSLWKLWISLVEPQTPQIREPAMRLGATLLRSTLCEITQEAARIEILGKSANF